MNRPWSLAFLPGERILLSQLSGEFRIINSQGVAGQPLKGVPEVLFGGQGGLSDVITDPDFQYNNTIYFSYAARDPEQNNRPTLFVARATLTDSALENTDVIFKAIAPRDAPVHYGAKLAFLPDGTLVIASGDGFDFREKAQSLDNHFGKIVRINPDGSVPTDNPFVHRSGALPEIWSYGHRNMQGLVVTEDGTLYEHEHGPRGGDEFNIIEKGANYGWPLICYCLDYSFAVITPFTEGEGLEQPLKYWRPSIAPSGMAYYSAGVFPQWKGSFFITGLVPGDVRRVFPKPGEHEKPHKYEEEVLFAEIGSRLRNIYQTPEGNLMILTDGPEGKLITVRPAERRSGQ